MSDGTFELFDLRVVVEEVRGRCTCDHVSGDAFESRGGKLSLPEGRSFCLYALQAAIPLLPAKQRPLQPNDWMATDARVVSAPTRSAGWSCGSTGSAGAGYTTTT
jgi:uncharacterized repeat protein (TIGR04076 family)